MKKYSEVVMLYSYAECVSLSFKGSVKLNSLLANFHTCLKQLFSLKNVCWSNLRVFNLCFVFVALCYETAHADANPNLLALITLMFPWYR